MKVIERLNHYSKLLRLHKPIGIFLLLWPTLWALWLASGGNPDREVVILFILGVCIMRSAGCIINDYADRKLDAAVRRTRERPLAAKRITTQEALLLFVFLLVLAFLLVLQLKPQTIYYAFLGVIITIFYPFMKRFTHLPQLGLGIAFSCGIPMAFAAEGATLGWAAWFLFLTAMLWPVIYDTLYAMTDREDDLKVGIKSTAILFGAADRLILALLQFVFLAALVVVGLAFHLGWPYYSSLGLTALFFVYQQWLIVDRDPGQCFKAFLNNNWIGFFIFIGIVLSYY